MAFTISAHNVAHAVTAAASGPIPEGAPATIELGMREDSGREEA